MMSNCFKAHDQRPAEDKPIDITYINTTPPNAHGFVSFGPHQWNKRMYVRRARMAVAEVDATMTRTHGDVYMHVSEFDYFVDGTPPPPDLALIERELAKMDDAKRAGVRKVIEEMGVERIAPVIQYLARMSLDGFAGGDGGGRAAGGIQEDCRILERGYRGRRDHPDWGGRPVLADAAAGGLQSKERPRAAYRDGRAGHREAGRRGNHQWAEEDHPSWQSHRECMVGSDPADLAIINDNPAFELYDPEYVLDIGVIRSNHKQTSINNALSVDLTGQINSETVTGARMINGTGGQPETHMGAFLSKGGRAITLLQSTALDGAISRIVPQLEAGALVTVPALLRRHRDNRVRHREAVRQESSRAGGGIDGRCAHPDHRAELQSEAKRLFG